MRMALRLKGCAKLSYAESRGSLLKTEEKRGRDEIHVEQIALVSGFPIPVLVPNCLASNLFPESISNPFQDCILHLY